MTKEAQSFPLENEEEQEPTGDNVPGDVVEITMPQAQEVQALVQCLMFISTVSQTRV